MWARNTFDYRKIRVINNENDYRCIANQLNSDCRDYNVLGFDCEWVPWYDEVALLQLCTGRGNIYLIRTCKMPKLPQDLKQLLENKAILKVGVDGWRDAQKLEDKYHIGTIGTLDLRFLAEACHARPVGLGKLAINHLEMNAWKDTSNFSKWENHTLDFESQKYAAMDAFASIELFKYFAVRLRPRGLRIPITCFDVLGQDRLDERYVYRSERDIVCPESGWPGEPDDPVDSVEPRGGHSQELQQSEGVSGFGLALAAGAIALGGFLLYRNQPQD